MSIEDLEGRIEELERMLEAQSPEDLENLAKEAVKQEVYKQDLVTAVGKMLEWVKDEGVYLRPTDQHFIILDTLYGKING